MESTQINYSKKLFSYISKEKTAVYNIYFYAILNGLVELSVPLGIQSIISFVMGASMATSLYILIFFVVLGTGLVGFFKLKVMQIIETIRQKIFVEFSMEFARKIPKVDLGDTRKYYLPELVNRFFDAQNLQKGISKILLDIPSALIQIVFGIVLLAFYHPWFLVFGALVIICVLIVFKFTIVSGIQSSISESDRKYEVASWFEDIAGSVKTFKMNSLSELHLHGTDERVSSYLKDRTSHFRVLMFQYKTIISFKVIITLLMLSICTYLLINQQLNIGAFIATEIVVLSIMSAVEKLIVSLESYYDVTASLVKLSKVTELAEEDKGQIIMEKQNIGVEVEFEQVSFSFNDNQTILKDINCLIPANSLTVISGELGSGKTLLINMLCGFYPPTAGMIFFDKIPLSNLDKNSFRNEMGIYLEDMNILKGTLLENIVLGDKSISTEDIVKLSREIGLDNIASQFSNGFFTEISQTNTEISFSSKKKILLLRALLGKNRLLLLEDPFIGMNENFTMKMLEYLQNKKQDTSIIIVSENKALWQIADKHLMMQNGTLTTL